MTDKKDLDRTDVTAKPPVSPKPIERDWNDEIMVDDWWIRLTRIFHRLIGKSK